MRPHRAIGAWALSVHLSFQEPPPRNDMLVPRRRDACAALRPMRRLLKKQSLAPKLLVIDKLRSYSSKFFWRFWLTCWHEQGVDEEQSCPEPASGVRRPERKMQRFKSTHPLYAF